MSEPLRCDCEPHVWPDGSISREDECEIYPWCPHELGRIVCDIPCGCNCHGCSALAEGHHAFAEERPLACEQGCWYCSAVSARVSGTTPTDKDDHED